MNKNTLNHYMKSIDKNTSVECEFVFARVCNLWLPVVQIILSTSSMKGVSDGRTDPKKLRITMLFNIGKMCAAKIYEFYYFGEWMDANEYGKWKMCTQIQTYFTSFTLRTFLWLFGVCGTQCMHIRLVSLLNELFNKQSQRNGTKNVCHIYVSYKYLLCGFWS